MGRDGRSWTLDGSRRTGFRRHSSLVGPSENEQRGSRACLPGAALLTFTFRTRPVERRIQKLTRILCPDYRRRDLRRCAPSRRVGVALARCR
jgi:hypothetical protein